MSRPIAIRHSMPSTANPVTYAHTVEVFASGSIPGKSLNTVEVAFRRTHEPLGCEKPPEVNYSSSGHCTPDVAESRVQAILEAVRIARDGWQHVTDIQTFEQWRKYNV